MYALYTNGQNFKICVQLAKIPAVLVRSERAYVVMDFFQSHYLG